MERREALISIGLFGGSALVPAVLAEFLSSCSGKDMSRYTPVFFTDKEYKLVTRLIDIIIPATGSASASQANTQVFLDKVYQLCKTPKEQDELHAGLKEFETGFSAAKNPAAFVKELDEKAFADKKYYGWYRQLKRFTMIGFYTSQEGTTRAANYVKVPDAYLGDIKADEKTLNYGKTNLNF